MFCTGLYTKVVDNEVGWSHLRKGSASQTGNLAMAREGRDQLGTYRLHFRDRFQPKRYLLQRLEIDENRVVRRSSRKVYRLWTGFSQSQRWDENTGVHLMRATNDANRFCGLENDKYEIQARRLSGWTSEIVRWVE